jgi:phage baseplate assembly protein W
VAKTLVPKFRVPFQVLAGQLQTYEDLVLDLGPSLYWRLGDDGGLIDRSQNGRDGTANGAPTIGGVPGPLADRDDDAATAFNGSTQFVSSAYSAFTVGSVRTFMAWVYRTDTSGNHVIFSGSGATRPFLWLAASTQDVIWQAKQGAGNATTWTAAWPGNKQWVHVAVVFDDANNLATLYLNGALISAKAHINTYEGAGNFQIAAFTGSLLKGSLDEVAVFERGLAADEIQAIYDFGVRQEPTILVPARVPTVEQDSAREIEQCIHAVLSTPAGSRIEAPDFGRPRRLFSQLSTNPTADAYLAAVERDEPRARVVGEARVEEMVEQIAVRREAPNV